MIHLVNTDETGGQLEHVVSERNNDELGVLGTLLDVVGDNGNLEMANVSIASCNFAGVLTAWQNLRF